MMKNTVQIKRAGYTWPIRRVLTNEERKDLRYYRRKTITEKKEIVEAKVISPRLALFNYEPATKYTEARYHVIHIPTGLVIADVTYDLVKDVKATFEKSKWILKKGTDNTLQIFESAFKFEMTCLIRYDVIEREKQ